MVLKRLQKFKDKHGIGISGSRNKKKREDSAREVNTSRPRKNKRGRTTGKEYWNPITGKWQTTPVKAPVTKDHLNRDPSVGAANRKRIRENPVSDETLKKVRESMSKKKKNGNGTTKTNGNGAQKNNLKVEVNPSIGSKLPKKFDKPATKGKTDKPAKKMSRLEKQNRARHGDKAIDHLKKKNTAFQQMKKGKMTKAEFIKKFPNSITAQKAAGLRRR